MITIVEKGISAVFTKGLQKVRRIERNIKIMLKKIFNKHLKEYLDKDMKDYLDDYLLDVLKKELRGGVLSKFNLDFNYFERDDSIYLQVKHRKYLEDYYTSIFRFGKRRVILYLINFEETQSKIEEGIREYLEKERR